MALITNKLQQIKSQIERYFYSRHQSKFSKLQTFTEASKRFSTRNELHAYMFYYFLNHAPREIREHRNYFSQERRGFGEDALHSMWWSLLSEFKPSLVLEIGVYRGQVTSLMGLIAKLNGFECEVHGISPFSHAGDGVSTYLENLDYMRDALASNDYFDLPSPNFFKAYSTDPIAIEYIKSQKWDLIYIDGNHDYEVALSDYEVCCNSLANGGLLVMDDSSLYTDFSPPSFSFAGHPGPSRVVQERAMNELTFIGGVGHNNVFRK